MAKKVGVGDTFQQETKCRRGHLPGGGLDWVTKPKTYKSYPSTLKIALSPPQTEDGAPIWDVVAEYLRDRKTVRVDRLNSPTLKNVGSNAGLADYPA